MAETAKTSKTPSHYVYMVEETKQKKGFWTKIGAAWAHQDGRGFNIQLSAFPVSGELVLRDKSEAKE
jgi:hypothetical protein